LQRQEKRLKRAGAAATTATYFMSKNTDPKSQPKDPNKVTHVITPLPDEGGFHVHDKSGNLIGHHADKDSAEAQVKSLYPETPEDKKEREKAEAAELEPEPESKPKH
jgi:hypothetical protein